MSCYRQKFSYTRVHAVRSLIRNISVLVFLFPEYVWYIILIIYYVNTWDDFASPWTPEATLTHLSKRFCSFDAMQSSWPAEKLNVESNDLWSETRKIEKEYVQTELMCNVWSTCEAFFFFFCRGHSEVCCWKSWFPDVSSGPDLCKVRRLNGGGRRRLAALLIEKVQMLIPSRHTKRFSSHCGSVVSPLLIPSSCSQGSQCAAHRLFAFQADLMTAKT